MSSHRHAPPPTKEMSRAKSVRKSTTISGAVASLQYTAASKVDAHLSSLTDNRSNYPAVARSCLQLNQFAGTDQTQPLHDSMYAKTTSSRFSALFQCIEFHEDRRCRILAAKTLALCARSTYAQLRHSPLLFSVRDGTLYRLEDEVGTDIPVALCTVAMEDADDGVSASALEALGILTLCSSAMPGTMVDDELLRQVEGIASARRSPYAPSLSDLSDEDPSIPQMELQSRVYENVLLPRIWRIVKRVLQFPNATDILRTLPFLTSVLVHLVKLMPSTVLGMDRATYAKRWIEVDILGLVHQVVTDLIMPSLQESSHGGLQYACALAGLRLAHVSPYSSWTRPVCNFSANVLVQELSASSTVVEHTLSLLASLVVALRGLPLTERMTSLEVVVNEIRFLPATSLVPAVVTSPSVKIGKYNRRSNRMGLLTEVALSILIDGPSEKLRSKSLKEFLSSPEVTALLISRRRKKNNRKWPSNQSTESTAQADNSGDSNGAPGGKTPTEAFTTTHVAEEFVLAFCTVASAYGREVVASGKSVKNRHVQEWLRCSMAILSSSCSACVNWKSRTSGVASTTEEEADDTSDSLFTMLTACQAAYIRLMVETMHALGFLSPTSSVALHLVPLTTPPHVLILEELAQAISSLANFTPIKGSQFLHQKEMTTLADQFLEHKFREGVPSRHHRIALIALFADHWVQVLDNSVSSDQAYGMNDTNARELLTLLSAEIAALTKSLKEETGNNQVILRYLDVCVASVENIALMALDWARRHRSSTSTNNSFCKDIGEDVTYIVSTATAALEGKNLREMDVLDDDKSLQTEENPYPMLPICAEAVKRIQSVSTGQQRGASYGVKAFLHSLLVTTADRDFKRRVSNSADNPKAIRYANVERSPFISVDPEQGTDEPLVIGDASVHAYFVQYCTQLIWSRIDQSLQASTLTDLVDTPTLSIAPDGEEKQGVIKARNWLRLAAPPKSAGTPLASRVSCAGAVTTLSGASDPVIFVIAYSMRRCLRYDCELEYKLFVTLRVHNVTAVKIPHGVRMDLRVTQQRSAFDVTEENTGEDRVLASKTSVFKQEIKAGDQVTWEVALENWPVRGFLELHPSVTFREMDAEHVPPKMVIMTPVSKEEDGSKEEPSSKRDEETDTQTDDHTEGFSVEERTLGDEEDETIDVILTAEPVQLSPMLTMQPCPLVFFRERGGDLNTFRFLWYQMPHRMSEMAIYPNQLPGKLIGSSSDDFGAAVARLSCISPINEYIESMGTATRGWAFMTLTGNRLLCLMIEGSTADEAGHPSLTSTLHFRADDEALLYSIIGSDSTRNVVVTSLTEDKWTCESQNSDIFGY